MKRQKTMFSFLSASEGKKSRMETVTGNSNFSGKQISNGQAMKNLLLELPDQKCQLDKPCIAELTNTRVCERKGSPRLKIIFIHVKSA